MGKSSWLSADPPVASFTASSGRRAHLHAEARGAGKTLHPRLLALRRNIALHRPHATLNGGYRGRTGSRRASTLTNALACKPMIPPAHPPGLKCPQTRSKPPHAKLSEIGLARIHTYTRFDLKRGRRVARLVVDGRHHPFTCSRTSRTRSTDPSFFILFLNGAFHARNVRAVVGCSSELRRDTTSPSPWALLTYPSFHKTEKKETGGRGRGRNPVKHERVIALSGLPPAARLHGTPSRDFLSLPISFGSRSCLFARVTRLRRMTTATGGKAGIVVRKRRR